MRLDHLLSKEHMAQLFACRVFGSGGWLVVSRAAPETFALGVVLMGGTLTSRPIARGALSVQLLVPLGSGEQEPGRDGVGLA